MQHYRLRIFCLVLLLGVGATASATELRSGKIAFANSGAAPAQKDFVAGVLYLHSFAYDQARAAFRLAQQADPQFALAFWGEAMTYNHTVWLEQDLPAARAVLTRLGSTAAERLAKAPTAREKGYLRALDNLYGEGDKRARNLAYAQAMCRLSEQYKDDDEAAAFCALALLGQDSGERDEHTIMQAAGIALGIIMHNAEHPGALHYFIHAVDDPKRAPLALSIARSYEQAVNSTPHALHMPSHIYGPLGLWEDSARVNLADWRLAEAQREKSHAPAESRDYHALSWLVHAHLQLGQYIEARKFLNIFRDEVAGEHGSNARKNYSLLRATAYGITGDSVDIQQTPYCETRDLPALYAACETSNRTYKALAENDLTVAQGHLAGLQELLGGLQNVTGQIEQNARFGIKEFRCSVPFAQVIATQLAAELAHSAGQIDEALRLLHLAATQAEAIEYADLAAPMPPKPPRERLGEILLELKRPADALVAYQEVLRAQPKRSIALLGLARAAAQVHDVNACNDAMAQLAINWRAADPQVRQLLTRVACALP